MKAWNQIGKQFKRIREQIPDCESFPKQSLVLIDYIYSKIRYHVKFEEYRQYAFYELRHCAKKQYVTEHDVLKVIPEQFNNDSQREILDDKAAFNDFFSDLLGRDYLLLDSEKMSDFLAFTEDKPCVIVKPTNSWCGKGVKKYELSKNQESRIELFNQLISEYTSCLIEECFVQHEAMSRLNPDSVNTIRIISLKDQNNEIHIPFASVRIGREGSAVDNFCAGGMAAAVDAESGIIISIAYNGLGQGFVIHPDTGCTIIGYQIPEWNKVLNTVIGAAKRIPSMRFIGWDVVVRKDGKVCLIEGNSNPGARTIQMPLKRGIKPDYQRFLGSF